ncbi:hypothetical protein [Streptomyces sp. NPDC051684]|uniref:hypothetical protein n=1 Tax=Streptomyces sp. NPDC051684 TaxID=3365670 RepID=UPI0037BDD05E
MPAAVLAPLGSAAAESQEPATSDSAASCFWTGPFTSDQDKFNYAYVDTGALYWSSNYTLPEGAKLTLDGAYAHARYQSLNSYEPAAATPMTALNDQQIQPDPGSRNPFLAGAKRTFPRRSWTVQVATRAHRRRIRRTSSPTPCTRASRAATPSCCSTACTCPTAAATRPGASACPSPPSPWPTARR